MTGPSGPSGPGGPARDRSRLPFSAVVGQEEVKLALLLAAAQPRLGGVLLRGEKGSAKTTLARGLAALLPGEAPFVELPLGAGEDRVLGSIDLAELLTSGEARVRPGLLAAAHGGVLYVDEVNLLADHLVDALLDVAVSGVNRLERDGMSHTHPARFVLVGSMNPEEGELRPQLLDRFGLAVDVTASPDPALRSEAVRRQLAAEGETGAEGRFEAEDAVLRARLSAWHPASVPDQLVDLACRVALEVGAEGLRADLMLCRAAAALAGWEHRDLASEEDLRRVAPLVLAHRRRRGPFDQPGISPEDLDEAFASAARDPEDGDGGAGAAGGDGADHDDRAGDGPEAPGGGGGEQVVGSGAERQAPRLAAPRAEKAAGRVGRGAPVAGPSGRYLRDRTAGEDGARLAAVPTAVAVAGRRALQPGADPQRADLREAVLEQRRANLVILVVDTSGSMGTERRIAAAKGAALGLLTDAYQRRDRVALVVFRGEGAEVVLRPTGSVEIARARLAELPTGGATPVAAGLDLALTLARSAGSGDGLAPLVVLITDGRATVGSPDPLTAAREAAARLVAARVPSVVIDAEHGMPRLGLAGDLAAALGAPCVPLDQLTEQSSLDRTIRARLPVS